MTNAEIMEKYSGHFVEDFYGMESPEEWADTIDRCLQELVTAFGDEIRITQVKEKFGGLRVYFWFGRDDPGKCAANCARAWEIILRYEEEVAIKFPWKDRFRR